MAHTHSHHNHNPRTSFSISILANFLFVIFEAYYGFSANSMSLVADAWHNFGDVIGLVFSFLATLLHDRRPNEIYSYGFKRATIMAAVFNALFLVATSSIIGYESFLKLLYPEKVQETTMMWVAAVGVIINGGSALFFMQNRHTDLNFKAAWLHLLADACIALGVIFAGGLIWLTGWEILDGVVGLLIVATIIYSSWSLLRESLRLSLDAVPTQHDQEEIRRYLSEIPGVVRIHDLHIWGLSTRETALTAHLVMPNKMLSDADYFRINKDMLEKYHIQHVTLQVEKGQDDDHPCSQTDSCA